MSRRQAIAAVRRVLSSLARPLPDFSSMDSASTSGLLFAKLLLADVSPFSALPESGIEQDRTSNVTEPVIRTDLPTSRPLQTAISRPALQHRDASGNTVPAFSFRRAAGKSTPPGLRQQEAGNTPLELPSRPVLSDRGESGPEARTVGHTTPPDAKGSHAQTPLWHVEVSERHGLPSKPAIVLVDEIATEILAATKGQYSLPQASAAEQRDAARHRPATHDPGFSDIDSVDYAFPARHVASHAPSHPAAAEGSAGAPALEAPVFTSAIGEVPVRQSAGLNVSDLPFERTPASADLDAETLASLVNEVLAEQARRHGVDLS